MTFGFSTNCQKEIWQLAPLVTLLQPTKQQQPASARLVLPAVTFGSGGLHSTGTAVGQQQLGCLQQHT